MTELLGCVLATAPSGGLPTDAIIEVYGRFHLLILHFPIALIIAAALIELWRAVLRAETIASSTVVCIVLGGLGAAVAASSGWIHASHVNGSAPDDFVMSMHRWIGVGAAAIGFVAAFMAIISRLGKGRALVSITRVLILISAVTVGVASHFGGSMVWGGDYVIAPLLERPTETVVAIEEDQPVITDPVAPPPVAEPAIVTVSYAADVQPLLEQHCYRCHGATRQRGGIRLDSLEEVMLEVEPGDPSKSYLIEVMRLPEDHDLHMPKNKPSLPEEQIATIEAWILSLAVAADASEADVDAEPAVVDEQPETPAVTEDDYAAPEPAPLPVLDDQQRAVRDGIIQRLRDAGLIASVIAASEDGVEVRVGGGASSINDEHVALLAGLEPSLVILDLNSSGITDASLEQIGTFTHLRRLRLGQTAVSDAGLAHLTNLSELESLDLHMTSVTDAGLPHLDSLGQLRSLYLWQTGVSKTGAARVRAARPWIEVDLGSP